MWVRPAGKDTIVKPVQPLKVPSRIVTFAGTSIGARLVQPLKVPERVVTLAGRTIEERLVQPEKVEFRVVTPLGRVTLVKAVHPEKVLERTVNPSERTAEARAVHPDSAETSRLVTESGIVMLVMSLKFLSALVPMVVTPSGMLMDVTDLRGPLDPIVNGPSPVMVFTGKPAISAGMTMDVGVPEQLVIVTEVPSVV